MPFIIFRVKTMMFWNTPWRSSVPPMPSAISSQNAVTAAPQTCASDEAPEATASTSRPAYSGVSTSATADNRASAMMRVVRQGWARQ